MFGVFVAVGQCEPGVKRPNVVFNPKVGVPAPSVPAGRIDVILPVVRDPFFKSCFHGLPVDGAEVIEASFLRCAVGVVFPKPGVHPLLVEKGLRPIEVVIVGNFVVGSDAETTWVCSAFAFVSPKVIVA